MPSSMQVTSIEQGDAKSSEQVVRRARDVLSAGGLVVFPTETVYGIAASVASVGGYAALRRFKQRSDTRPFTVHLPGRESVTQYADVRGPIVQRLLRKLVPGPVTLIVEVDDAVIEAKLESMGLGSDVGKRLYHRNTIGLRCPDHPVAQQVLGSVAAPVVASSANGPGEPAPCDADEAVRAVDHGAQLLIDGGRCRFSKPSTIIRVGHGSSGASRVTVERAGVYDERFVRKLLRWSLLVVCSGNTCRSAMAEVLAKQILAQARGLKIDELESAGLGIGSAGVYAARGAEASPEAVEAMNALGLDLSQHRSRRLAHEMIYEADVTYCMTAGHVRAVQAMVPSAADRVFPLDPNLDVEDPIGSNANGYRRCAELIRRRMEERLQEQQI